MSFKMKNPNSIRYLLEILIVYSVKTVLSGRSMEMYAAAL